MDRSRQYYLAALLFGVLFHGTLMAFTLGDTYDAYVHMFFAEHYAQSWFDTWNYKWYTGFTMTSYPPLVHQGIALFSKLIGLKGGFIGCGLIMIALMIRGVFHFSLLWVDRLSAAYACLLLVVSSSFIEALHIFGQLPSLMGIALLLNACPYLYYWIRDNNRMAFYCALSVIAMMSCAHHVSTIFGTVFFVAPVLGVAVLDLCIDDKRGLSNVRIRDFIKKTWKLLPKGILLGVLIIAITITVIFPYWFWSKTDPITQVSIPHGSRANFIAEPNLGLVFFLIPWGLMLFFLPGIFGRIFSKRNLFLGLSFSLAFLLGTGGTTPIPKMILGENAFNILTLDRFTFWASMMALPFFGDLVRSLFEGSLGAYIKRAFGGLIHKGLVVSMVIGLLVVSALIINIAKFRPLQPEKIDPKPIANFMERDGHEKWRYLTLGFGDQVAWISAHTDALTVDGNYHSVRRLPEMTSRAVERLENSKYMGMEGLGSLQQFLAIPEKYHLKYVFNNDKFYEPVLYFFGWTKLSKLENNIDVWERKDILPLPSILPRKDIPSYQKAMWGIIPISVSIIAFLLVYFFRKRQENIVHRPDYDRDSKKLYPFYTLWFAAISFIALFLLYSVYKDNDPHRSPDKVLEQYFHALDFKEFEDAYGLFDPSTVVGLEQFLLELSLEDGLLASYAKLNSIDIKKKNTSDNRILYDVSAQWITAVESYTTTHQFELVEKNKKWFIKKEEYSLKTPPTQFFRIAELDFFNQGRRKATTQTTIREDILDRPEIHVMDVELVFRKGQYHIIGQLINADNDPAFVDLDVVLYDEKSNPLASYSSSDKLVHTLLPKESTPFRIDFEQIGLTHSDSLKNVFDPARTNPLQIIGSPKTMSLQVRSTVTDEPIYKYYGYDLEDDKDLVFINYGNREIAIPQVLLLFSENEKPFWLEVLYGSQGIRPQRSKTISIPTIELDEIKIVDVEKIVLINGQENKDMRSGLPNNFKSASSSGMEIKLNGLVNFKE